MANLNKLLFEIAIRDNATKEIEKVASQIDKALEDKTVKVNIDESQVKSNTQKLVAAKEQAARASQLLSAEEQRLAQAMNQTTQAAHSQSQVLSELKSMAMQYLGVWGGQQFIHNIIEIGGQLEMQRLSIGSILQNTAQANELFDKIKGLATQSPFGVVQLDQMTKQLTAYGFKYNELYDMTKRLADISAATGTEVSRLALALGHVRSEGALSGYTLRQFSMGNVPLLEKLSEKLGKTKKEIREMTRNKEIDYADVESVLKDLTNEGGMFYNMQEVISQSVKAKFKNVKDAMDIMYSEMAEGAPGEALKGVADVLMEVTKNWKDTATILGTGAAVWGLHKAGILALNFALGQNTAAVSANILSYKKKRAAELQGEAMVRELTDEELSLIATRKKITAENIRVALSTNAMTKGEALRLVGLRKLSLEEAKALIRSGEFTAEEVRMAMQGRVLGMNLGYAGNMMKYFASSAKMAMAALLTNPWTWAMAGITAVMELWQRNSSEMEKADELGQKIYDRAAEGLQKAKEMMKETDMAFSVGGNKASVENVGNVNGQISFPDAKNLSDDKIKATIEEWTTFIKDYAATPNIMLNAAFATDETGNAVHSLAEQYQILGENVKAVIEGLSRSKELSNAFAEAVKDADRGLFDDNLTTDMKEYEKASKDHFKLVNKTVSSYRKYADAALFAAKTNKAFLVALKDAKKESASTAEQIMFLAENAEKLKDAKDAFANAWQKESANDNNGTANMSWSGMFLTDNLDSKYSELREEFNQVADELEKSMSNWDFKNLDAGQIQALTLTITDSMSEAGLSVDQVRTKVMELCHERWPQIKIDADLVQARAEVNEMQQRLEKLVNPDGKGIGWLIPINTETNAGEVIEGIIKGYNAAKGFIEQDGISIKAKFGIASDAKIADWSDNKLKELAKGDELAFGILKELRDSYRIINQATKASKEYGFSLDKQNKKNGGSKTKGSGTTKSYKDEFAKRWDERIRIMKEAYSWYDKWEKKVGNDAAIAETNAKYADIFKEWRTDKLLPMDFDVSEIADYARYVEKIRDDALKRYQAQKNDKGKNNGQEALRVYRQAVALLNDVKFDNFAKAAEKFKSDMERTLSDLTRKWELFTSVRNATGNTEAASVLAGFGNDIPEAKDVAGAFKEYLQAEIAKMGDEVKIPIRFDKSMSKKEVEDMVKGALGGTKYKEQIDAITDGIQRWIELSKDAEKKAVDAYTAAMTKAMDYVSQVQRINAELAEQNRLIDENNNLSQKQKDRAKGINQANASMKILEASDSYKRFFNNVLGETKTELQGMANTIKAQLNDSLKKGAITAEDYAKKIKDIDNVMQQSEISDPDKWYNKGIFNTETMEQRFQLQRDQGNEKIQQGADMLQKGLNSGDGKLIADGQQMKEAGQNMVNGANKASLAMAIIDKVVHGIDQAVQGTVKAFDYIKEALESLGVDSDAMSTAGDYLHTLGEMSSHVTQSWDNFKSGNFVGASVEAVGAVTSVIKGISQAHDNRLERAIERLREDVQSIENNTSLILQARERTLGFDTGELRRNYANDYSPDEAQKNALQNTLLQFSALGKGFSSRAQKSMYEYYSKNSEGTGYQQQLANLKSERENYMAILDKQQKKKKKSNSDIEETKKKIAELDDQIRYFSQDLAKELFSIDIKGWADQLSDALASAFENGESMAKAYKETVTNILQQVMSKMMQMSILEPMFQNLQDRLFGNAEKNIAGAFNADDPSGSMSKITSVIADFFGKGGEGQKTITAATEFMTAFQKGLEESGLSILNDSSNTLSSSIQGTSEETSSLLAGYVNALRQDVAVNRILLSQFVAEMWPSYIEQVTNLVGATNRIDANVAAIRTLLSENGALFMIIDDMRSHFDGITNGTEEVYVH